MLHAEHVGRKYQKLTFAAVPKRPRSHERIVQCASPVFENTGLNFVSSLGDSEEMSKVEFVSYANKRAELALRRLRGEPLSMREQVLLRILNVLAKALLPHPKPLEREAVEAMEEFKRWKASQRARSDGEG
jgi:hypothetical protein